MAMRLMSTGSYLAVDAGGGRHRLEVLTEFEDVVGPGYFRSSVPGDWSAAPVEGAACSQRRSRSATRQIGIRDSLDAIRGTALFK